MRNFWFNADITGRKTSCCGGPKSRDGVIDVNIYQRNSGVSEKALSIRCEETTDGKLLTQVYSNEGSLVYEYTPNR